VAGTVAWRVLTPVAVARGKIVGVGEGGVVGVADAFGVAVRVGVALGVADGEAVGAGVEREAVGESTVVACGEG
jgi:hypothetical protein